MPEIFPSLPEARCSALERLLRNHPGAESSGLRCLSPMAPSVQTIGGNQGVDVHVRPVRTTQRTSDSSHGRTRQRGRRPNPRPHAPPPAPRPGRRPGTSQYYGVRFRPDLHKWVAEIRVAEWKAVDKKVWLGTFETEMAAARGVDLARKLLKCTKKHPPNLPGAKLSAYKSRIPPHLVLSDLTTAGMFKEATKFIKLECKQYAASFNDDDSGDHGHATMIFPVPKQTSNNSRRSSSSSSSSSPRAVGNDNPSDDYEVCGSDLMIQEYCCFDGAAVPTEPLLDSGFAVASSGFEVDSNSTTPNYSPNYELGMSSNSSSPRSCISPGSCVTLEAAFPLPVPEREPVANCGGCLDAGLFLQCCRNISGGMAPEVVPEVEEGLAMMEEALAAEQLHASTAQSPWGADETALYPPWPALYPLWPALYPQDSSTPFLHQSTGATSYTSPMSGGDLDLWMFQGIP